MMSLKMDPYTYHYLIFDKSKKVQLEHLDGYVHKEERERDIETEGKT
jgi:hypothetical protein